MSLYDVHPIEDDNASMSVSVIIDGETSTVEVEPFSTIAEVLDDFDLPENIDYEAINMNQILFHRDIITLPIKTENMKISINTGSVDALISVPGIGPATAASIVSYRNEVGQFQVLEDIMNVKGIGIKKFEKIKDLICL